MNVKDIECTHIQERTKYISRKRYRLKNSAINIVEYIEIIHNSCSD